MSKETIDAETLVKKLQKLIKKHGNLPVYLVSDYDAVLPCQYATAERDNGWAGEPNEKYIGLN